MKFSYLLALVFVAFVEAKEFDGSCFRLQLNGTVYITYGKENVTLDFEEAELLTNNSCTSIRLNLTESVEVRFLLEDASKDKYRIVPTVQLVPAVLFNELPDKKQETYKTSDEIDPFLRNESYTCISKTELNFTGPENITVVVTTTDFKIQSYNATHFLPGDSCAADKPTTPAPTTVPTTHTPTTVAPAYNQNFSCQENNVTRFRVTGVFSLSIKYNTTISGIKTATIDIPRVPPKVTYCTSDSNETLAFTFFEDKWGIGFIFEKDSTNKYYVANITVVYTFDEHLPNATHENENVTVKFSKPGFLEATTEGYYTCNAKLETQLNKDVTLTTTNFRYKAFNEKGDIDFNSGDITECSEDEKSSSIVPIAVGAALAGLVVIVLIAYLIGRRRSRKAGYESV